MESHLKYLVFDIETVADGALVSHLQYPGLNLNPKSAILKYQEDLISQNGSSFIPHTFQLPVSIAVAAVNQNFNLIGISTLDRGGFRPHIIAQKFWTMWNSRNCPTFVTYNGRGFDLPVMENCAFRYGISLPKWFSNEGPSYSQARNRFNPAYHFDIMEFLSNFGSSRQTGGLNLAATLLGKPGKMDTKGSMVQELWWEQKFEEIDDYCLCDTLDTYFVFLRTQVLLGKISLDQEQTIVADARLFIENQTENYPILKEYLKHFRSWQALEESQLGFFDDFNEK